MNSATSIIRSVTLLVGLLVAGYTNASDPDWVQPTIDVAKSTEKSAQERIDAATRLTTEWKESMPGLIQDLNAFHRTEIGPPYTPDDVVGLLPLTDILVTIVLSKDGSVAEFRNQSDGEKAETVKLLTWATRRPRAKEQNQKLRFNAAYILASVVDNSTLCIVLHHLRDPRLGANGKVNLLQVATVATLSANAANVEAAEKTVAVLEPRVAKSDELEVLLNALRQSIKVAKENPPTGQETGCTDYDYDAQLESLDTTSQR